MKVNMPDFNIRPSIESDTPHIESLYRETFTGEDLVPLVRALLSEQTGVVSRVGERNGTILAHVTFTICSITQELAPAALLGPLAVAPAVQKKGLGSRLVREGLAQLPERGVGAVFVLGDPNYYAKFGFVADTKVVPPYPLVTEYRSGWQSLALGARQRPCAGQLIVPAVWQRPSLWSP